MKRKHALLMALITLMIGLTLQAAPQKKRIAVLDFDFSGVQHWWGGYNWDIGAGVADIVVTDLVKDGTYSVIERQALDSVLAEQNFSNSDRADSSSAAKIGKVLGVDAIVVGAITQFGTEKKKKSFGGFGGNWGGFGGGKIGKEEGKANVAINARLVDVNTGEILAVAEGKGVSSRSGLLLGGAGGGSGGYGGGDIQMTSSDFRDTILGEAVYEASTKVSQELIEAQGKVPTHKVEIRGLVAYAEGGTVIINVGSNSGVEVGTELSVERVKQTIKDPATGRVLRELTSQVARIKVTQVDADSSEATVISGEGIKTGDVVRN
jgi:curli biogenesis system outer membrane secretion channel CsgG